MLICEKRKGTTGYDMVRERKGRDLKPENCEVEEWLFKQSCAVLLGICSIALA